MRDYLTLFTEAGFAPTNLEYNTRHRTQSFTIRLLANSYYIWCSDGGDPFLHIINQTSKSVFNVDGEPPAMSHIIDFIIQETKA